MVIRDDCYHLGYHLMNLDNYKTVLWAQETFKNIYAIFGKRDGILKSVCIQVL